MSFMRSSSIDVHPSSLNDSGGMLACQAQNRTTIPSKSGDGGHTLRLTGTATSTQSRPVHEDDLEVGKESVDDRLGRCWVS